MGVFEGGEVGGLDAGLVFILGLGLCLSYVVFGFSPFDFSGGGETYILMKNARVGVKRELWGIF